MRFSEMPSMISGTNCEPLYMYNVNCYYRGHFQGAVNYFLKSSRFRLLAFYKASHMKAFKKYWEDFSGLKILFCVFTVYSLSFFFFFSLDLGIPGVL